MATSFRRSGCEVLGILGRADDPAAESGHVILYAKAVAGAMQLFARASDGTVSQIIGVTQMGNAAAGSSGSRFRRSGAGIARILQLSADPATQPGHVLVYSKAVSGIAQLFTRTSDGAVSQLTPNLTSVASPGAAATQVRRAGAEVLSFIERVDDPPAVSGQALLYSKNIGGVARLFAQSDNGTVIATSIVGLVVIAGRWRLAGGVAWRGAQRQSGAGRNAGHRSVRSAGNPVHAGAAQLANRAVG